jgi:hypothetical protein
MTLLITTIFIALNIGFINYNDITSNLFHLQVTSHDSKLKITCVAHINVISKVGKIIFLMNIVALPKFKPVGLILFPSSQLSGSSLLESLAAVEIFYSSRHSTRGEVS